MRLHLYYYTRGRIVFNAIVNGNPPSISDVIFTASHGPGRVTHTGEHYDEAGEVDGLTVLLAPVIYAKESP